LIIFLYELLHLLLVMMLLLWLTHLVHVCDAVAAP
jgi:hypothetical protein